VKKQTVRMDTTNDDREDNMKNITCKLSLAIIVCATLCLGCTYTYTEVLPPGWRNAHATSINDNGDVAGWGDDSTGKFKGFVYSGGNYTELLPPGWDWAAATSINNNGDVAGRGVDGTGKSKGFVYSGGVYTEMLPPGWSRSRSIEKLRFYIDSQVFTYCINNKGTVVITRSISRYFIAIPLPTIIKSFIATPRQRARNS